MTNFFLSLYYLLYIPIFYYTYYVINNLIYLAFKYAGLLGATCTCGNSYGKHPPIEGGGVCTTTCPGAGEQICGNQGLLNLENSVYSTGYMGNIYLTVFYS